jgi:hypothetical protein
MTLDATGGARYHSNIFVRRSQHQARQHSSFFIDKNNNL